MKISDLLWEAANNHLWNGIGPQLGVATTFSCDTVYKVCDIYGDLWSYQRCRGFLKTLGLDPQSMTAFSEFEEGEERQGARYLWLMFAYTYAKEQGL